MSFKEQCIDSKRTCSENKTRITFESSEKIQRIKIDGCQITSGKRCDYLIICNEEWHYVELKGTAIKDAFEQIGSTIEVIDSKPYRRSKAHIVYYPGHGLDTTTIQRRKRDMKKRYGTIVHLHKSPCKVRI